MFAPIYFGRRTNEYRAAVSFSPTEHVDLKEFDVETLRDACAGTVLARGSDAALRHAGLATCLAHFRSHEGNDVAINWNAPIVHASACAAGADPSLPVTFR